MLRSPQDRHRGALLAHTAVEEDECAIGDSSDEAEVVGDEQHAEPQLGAQPAEQRDDRCLDGYVEGAGDLIADDELRLGSEGARDCDALTLSAGELGGITLSESRGESNEVHETDNLRRESRLSNASKHLRRPADQILDPVSWVERVGGVLKDELDAALLLARASGHQRFAGQSDLTGGDGVEPGDRSRDRSLAAARLAHERDALASRNGEAHVTRGDDKLAARPVLSGQGFDLERGRHLDRVTLGLRHDGGELRRLRLLPPDASHGATAFRAHVWW